LEARHAKSQIDCSDRRASHSPNAHSFSHRLFRFDADFRSGVLENGKRLWVNASLWMLGVGLIMAALAAVMGLIDVLGDVQIRNLSDAWLHAGGNGVAVVIELYNWYSRYEHGSAAVIPTGLILSLVVVLILVFTGWKGWEMVYRHRVGVADQSPVG
jgi:uncharacterized membrane protein